MEAENIRALLSVPTNKLERIAKKMEMPLPVARDIRVQAMNIVLGRCILCQKPTLAGMCGACKREAPSRRLVPWTSIKLLKRLRPTDQLLSRTCNVCGHDFMLSAAYLLRRLRAKSPEEVKSTCRRCVEAAEKERLRKEAEEAERLWKEEQERRARIRDRIISKAPHLLQRPFSHCRELLSLKVGPQKGAKKGPPTKTPPKEAKRAQKGPK